MKTCLKCGESKPMSEFHRLSRAKDGRKGRCRDCCNSALRAKYHTNVDAQRERRRQWRKDNPEKWRDSYTKWRAENKDKVIEGDRMRRVKNKDRIRERDRMRAIQSPESIQAKNAINNAIRDGRLTRPTRCENCGATPGFSGCGSSKIDAHHDDYSKPFDVRWWCKSCHVKYHKGNAAGGFSLLEGN